MTTDAIAAGRLSKGHEVQAIGLVLDEAISASIAAYVRQHDEYTNRIEASLRARATELSEADRHEQLSAAVTGKLDRYEFSEARRAAPNIDGDAKNATARHANQLGLGGRRLLEVKAAQRAPA